MSGYIVKNVPGDADRFHVYRGDEKAPAFKAVTISSAFGWIDADKAQSGPLIRCPNCPRENCECLPE
ncbi:hypothetical protein V2S84_02740 [Azotobacter chroococcum]|nr:hypothetical protein [Azotobacter chroococcum]